MIIEKFEDIIAWKKAKSLIVEIYKIMKGCRDYGFRDQIQRAAVSIMNNMAEGFERRGDKEFKQFLYISKGSCGEVRSMTYLGIDLHYITAEEGKKIDQQALEISKMLFGLIKSLH